MAVNATAAAHLLASLNPLSIGLSVLSIVLLKALHGLTTDRLRHIPGPFIARLTPIWYWYIVWTGIECRALAALHKKYGPVIRIAPNEIDICDGAAVPPIYIDNGGFPKHPAYRNFDIDGFPTIFSATDNAHRAVRAKAVAPLFAQQAINNGKPAMQGIIDATLSELGRRKSLAEGRPVDLLDLFRCMAMDVMTKYLVGECFNSVGSERLSATGFVDSFAAAGRFFYLPSWFFSAVDYFASKLDKNRVLIATSVDTVHRFAGKVVDDSIAQGEKATYQGRLLKAGISREETIAQIVDIMFAGTDGIARILAVFCWHMAQAPDKYDRAFEEIVQNPDTDARSLPYLSGAVKEAARLALANPTRLARIVPSGGLKVPGLPTIPAGTSVGIGAYALHLSPEVFPTPYEFLPERWLECTPEMLRDSFYFGRGPRQCIARNFASAIVWWAAEALVRNRVLDGAEPVQEKIEIVEWFNSKQVGDNIELSWP
ncbi:cytochrome P450 [Trichoderma citrinoviride]|uniref:Cytochrome P450 n=1 Tax=Trichoderma citrinoviride TaxID=58853 RepID=A0A2T4BBH7_9HYPO|nr:cytochrome P450 [Trichoderma citrinoviride]PTB66693.1 cytochrome P450 [Trichoderma citrinoviride]